MSGMSEKELYPAQGPWGVRVLSMVQTVVRGAQRENNEINDRERPIYRGRHTLVDIPVSLLGIPDVQE